MNDAPSLLHVSLKDFFTFEVLKLALVPLLLTMFVLYLLFFSTADSLITQLQQVELEVQSQSMHEPSPSDEGILAWLLKYSLTSWIAGFLLYTVGIIVVMYLSIFTTLFIIGFMTPLIVGIVHRRHYPQQQLHGFGSITTVLWHFIKTLIVMLVLLLILMPLYFVPLLGLLVLHLPFYYFFHRLLNYDVASTICSKAEYEQLMRTRGSAVRLHTFWMYLATMIPFIALFAMLFFVLFLSHFYFQARRSNSTIVMIEASR